MVFWHKTLSDIDTNYFKQQRLYILNARLSCLYSHPGDYIDYSQDDKLSKSIRHYSEYYTDWSTWPTEHMYAWL